MLGVFLYPPEKFVLFCQKEQTLYRRPFWFSETDTPVSVLLILVVVVFGGEVNTKSYVSCLKGPLWIFLINKHSYFYFQYLSHIVCEILKPNTQGESIFFL